MNLVMTSNDKSFDIDSESGCYGYIMNHLVLTGAASTILSIMGKISPSKATFYLKMKSEREKLQAEKADLEIERDMYKKDRDNVSAERRKIEDDITKLFVLSNNLIKQSEKGCTYCTMESESVNGYECMLHGPLRKYLKELRKNKL